MGLDVEVKDASRPHEWSYYNFDPGVTSAEVMPGGGCNKCHNDNAAVEHTFVQFYPTLLDFATDKGLIKPTVNIPLNESRFLKLVSNSGWNAAEQAYEADRQKNPDSDLLNEHVLNMMGFQLQGDKKQAEAISVFKLVTKKYPNSINAYDNLADAYAEAKQADLAITASKQEMALAQGDSTLTAERKKYFTDLAQKRIEAMSKH